MYNNLHMKKLSVLKRSDKVWIIDMWLYTKIIDQDDSNSYFIGTESGGKIRRNRWHLVSVSYKHSLKMNGVSVPIITPEPARTSTAISSSVNYNQNMNSENPRAQGKVVRNDNLDDNVGYLGIENLPKYWSVLCEYITSTTYKVTNKDNNALWTKRVRHERSCYAWTIPKP